MKTKADVNPDQACDCLLSSNVGERQSHRLVDLGFEGAEQVVNGTACAWCAVSPEEVFVEGCGVTGVSWNFQTAVDDFGCGWAQLSGKLDKFDPDDDVLGFHFQNDFVSVEVLVEEVVSS